jgi:hypothetical protein
MPRPLAGAAIPGLTRSPSPGPCVALRPAAPARVVVLSVKPTTVSTESSPSRSNGSPIDFASTWRHPPWAVDLASSGHMRAAHACPRGRGARHSRLKPTSSRAPAAATGAARVDSSPGRGSGPFLHFSLFFVNSCRNTCAAFNSPKIV